MRIRNVLSLLVLCFPLLVSSVCADGGSGQAVDPAQVRQMQEQMLNNPDIMTLITALQNDPEMQTLLNDPAVMEAARKGDVTALAGDARILKLLENAKVREIMKQVR